MQTILTNINSIQNKLDKLYNPIITEKIIVYVDASCYDNILTIKKGYLYGIIFKNIFVITKVDELLDEYIEDIVIGIIVNSKKFDYDFSNKVRWLGKKYIMISNYNNKLEGLYLDDVNNNVKINRIIQESSTQNAYWLWKISDDNNYIEEIAKNNYEFEYIHGITDYEYRNAIINKTSKTKIGIIYSQRNGTINNGEINKFFEKYPDEKVCVVLNKYNCIDIDTKKELFINKICVQQFIYLKNGGLIAEKINYFDLIK